MGAAVLALIPGCGSVVPGTPLPANYREQGIDAAVAVDADSETFDLRGRFALQDFEGFVDLGDGCVGIRGYDDIGAGTQITVSDSGGKVVALGELGRGVENDEYGCVYLFLVEDVPGGAGFYSVEISHRGSMRISEADARAGKFEAGLG
ncbi:hypothetical protein [Nakamurella leprariae]|uniref:Uncharacterized protein n=1 Tax=Nakamurella leprariae TaxID=2803911 RepID=A0A939BYF7_9ACTN|nr:hypothetical protein [Nakamurella leprariae]MBM9469508.1 hypothetical protein [Nakamurella leprariae]